MNIISRKKVGILVQLAEVDGDYHPLEEKFIIGVAARHGISEAEIQEIKAATEPIGSLGALSYRTCVDYLTDVLQLLPVDGKILPSEVVFCEDIAMRLGFTKKGVDRLIEIIRQKTDLSKGRLGQMLLRIPHGSRPTDLRKEKVN